MNLTPLIVLHTCWTLARVGLHYRALAVDAEDGQVWCWIGSHADNDKLVG